MGRIVTYCLVGIMGTLVVFSPLHVLPDDEKGSSLQSDKRLAQTVFCQGVNQPVQRLLESLTTQLKVPLWAQGKTAALRLTVSGPPRSAHKFMELIAKTLNAKWQRDGEGYLLVCSAPAHPLSQAEQERMHSEFHIREWQEIKQESDHQTQELLTEILKSSRLTDEEILALASRYPLIRKRFERKEILMCARLLTWLTKDQLAQAFATNRWEWGVKLTREQVLKTGSDYDLGFSHLYIRILPDRAVPVQCTLFFTSPDPNDKRWSIRVVVF